MLVQKGADIQGVVVYNTAFVVTRPSQRGRKETGGKV